MNCIRDLMKQGVGLLGLGVVLLLAGCESNDPYGAVNPPNPWTPALAGGASDVEPGTPGADTNSLWVPDTGTTAAAVLRVGDLVGVSFSDVPTPPTQTEQRIREDGNITLPLNVTVAAAGKSVGQLREDIQKAYVPKYFNHITITLAIQEQVYFVGGEVREPGPKPHLGHMTVLSAIDAAGGFTEFARRTKIQVNRANKEVRTINYDKAIRDASLDLPLHPGDRVYVPRRRL